MKNIYKYNERATLCANNNCVTVYGEAAKLINTIAVCAALIIAVAYVAKAFR